MLVVNPLINYSIKSSGIPQRSQCILFVQCIYFLKEKNAFNTNVILIVKDSLNHLSIHLTDFSGALSCARNISGKKYCKKCGM